MVGTMDITKDELSSHPSNEEQDEKIIAGAPGVVVVPEDPAAPSRDVSSKRQSLSDIFTIVRVSCSQNLVLY